MKPALRISARDNPLLQRLRRLSRDPSAYRQDGSVWLEGAHLCSALQARGQHAAQAVYSDSGWAQPALQDLAAAAQRSVVLPDALFASISALGSPAGVGMLVDLPLDVALASGRNTVVLDRVQDAGNVGSILRSAAAFGVLQVLALQGTASLWSPKVLRAGMGAHFALRLREGLAGEQLPDLLQSLQLPLVAASSHAQASLFDVALPAPCAWIFGHEGQGIAQHLLRACAVSVRIPQPGGEESLNVAAAAAVCLCESMRQGS